ncbi:MAG: hypothetical protein ACFFED_15115, partial [Candidatus Thorarchaeota archaeon]
MNNDLERELEQVSSEMWLAQEIHDLGGWQLRLNQDITWRANSILPLSSPGVPLEDALAYCTEYYRERGLQPRFQLTDFSYPSGLDDELRQRNWKTGIRVDTEILDIFDYKRKFSHCRVE